MDETIRLLLINHFSTLGLSLFFITLCIIFSFLISLVTYKYFPKILINRFNILYNIFTLFSTFVGILFAFTIVILWQMYNSAEEAVLQERDGIARIILISKALPTQQQNAINVAIKKYIYIVTNEEWPMMKWGKASLKATLANVNLFNTIISYGPNNVKILGFYQEIINDLRMQHEGRRQRLQKIHSSIPSAYFSIIVITLLLTLILVALMDDPDDEQKRVHKILMVFVSIIIGISITLIMELDFPFAGDKAVSNGSFKEGIVGHIMNNKMFLPG